MRQYIPIIILIIISLLIVVSSSLQSSKKEKSSIEEVFRSSSEESTPSGKLNQEKQKEATPEASISNDFNEQATKSADLVNIQTTKGEIQIKLNNTSAPKFVENFIKKIENDFYNGLIFHRVENWVVQGGDPKGDGKGGGAINTELSDNEFVRGSVGVARGPDINISNDSQFFILKQDSEFLNGLYTYFGEVTRGMDVVDNLEIGDKIEKMISIY